VNDSRKMLCVKKDHAEEADQSEDGGGEAQFSIREQADADDEQDCAGYIGENVFAVRPWRNRRKAASPPSGEEILEGEDSERNCKEDPADH